MFAVLKKYFLLFFFFYFLTLPCLANAGVLIRTVTRSRSYTPKSSTNATRITNPNLNYRGQTVLSQINYLEKLQKNYEKDLARWYKDKAKLEEKIAKERSKKDEQERRLALRSQRSFAHSRSDSSASRNPVSWFKKRIAGERDESETSNNRPKIEFKDSARGKLSEDKDLALNLDKSPKKKEGFWKKILQALGIG